MSSDYFSDHERRVTSEALWHKCDKCKEIVYREDFEATSSPTINLTAQILCSKNLLYLSCPDGSRTFHRRRN